MHLPINKAQGCNKGGKEAAVTQEETDAGVTAGGETAQHQSTATAHSDPKKFTFDFTSRRCLILGLMQMVQYPSR